MPQTEGGIAAPPKKKPPKPRPTPAVLPATDTSVGGNQFTLYVEPDFLTAKPPRGPGPWKDKQMAPDAVLGPADSLPLIERASMATLPTAVSWALATTGTKQADMLRAAKVTARYFDTPPLWFSGDDWRQMDDPYHPGKPMSFASLMRWSGLDAATLREMMGGILGTPISREGVRHGRYDHPDVVSPDAYARIVKELGPALAGNYVQATLGSAVAVEAARRGADPVVLGNNVRAWLEFAQREGLMDGSQESMATILVGALEAEMNGAKLLSARDVAEYLAPATAEEARKAEAAIASGQAAADAQLRGMGIRGLAVGTAPTELGRRALALILGSKETELHRDVFALMDDLEKDIELERTAFERSWLGKGLAVVGEAWDTGIRELEKGVTYLSTPAVGALYVAMDAVPGVDASWSLAFEQRDQVLADINGGKHVGQLFAEYAELPAWTGTALDFAIQWQVDPFILYGKAVKGYRSLRVAPGLLDKSIPSWRILKAASAAKTLPQRATDFLTMVRGTSALAAPELAGVLLSPKPGAVVDWVRGFSTRTRTAAAAWNEDALVQASKMMKARFTEVTDEAIYEAKHILQSQFAGIVPRQGTIAHLINNQAAVRANAAIQEFAATPYHARLFDELTGGLPASRIGTTDLVEEALRNNVADMTTMGTLLEVPYKLRPYPGMGGYTLAKQWLGLHGGKGSLGSLSNINPGSVMRIEENPTRWFEHWLRRWRTFDSSELSAARESLLSAGNSPAREAAMVSVVEKWGNDAIERIAVAKKLPAEAVESLKADLNRVLKTFRGETTESFAVLAQSEIASLSARRAIWETQLRNEVPFLDPVQVRRYVGRYKSSLARLERNMPPEIAALMKKGKPIASALENLDPSEWREWGRLVNRTWKFMVVPRPGYIGRVVLLDESLRQWATGFSLLERAAATNVDQAMQMALRVSATGALLGGGVEAALGQAIKSGAAMGVGAGTAVVGAAGLTGRASRAAAKLGKPFNAAFRRIFPNPTYKLGDEVVELGAMNQMAYQPLADTAWAAHEHMDDMMRQALGYESAMTSTGSWNVLDPSNRQYFPAYEHALNNQVGQSLPGRVALNSVAAGDDVVTTAARVKAWAQADNLSTFRRIGLEEEVLDEWAMTASQVAHGYTASDGTLATLALERKVTAADLAAKIPAKDLPRIHGPLIEFAAFGKGNRAGRLMDWWYETFVRMPENVLNRQPYYRMWKRRAEKSYYALAEQQGLKATEGLKASVDAASTKFALGQVKKIMFDFTENSRLGEMLGPIYPFVQPFQEAFQVWGHILWSRNPGLLGYAKVAWTGAQDSGFVRQEEEGGPWVIPMDWWAGNKTVMDVMAHVPGVRVFTPFLGINMFFASMIEVPTDGLLGQIAGGASIPMPGMAPWATFAFKKLLADSRNDAINSYLFEYGPNTSIGPVWLENFVRAMRPEWFTDERTNSLALQYLRYYQYEGLYEGMNEAQLQEQAMADARRFSAARGVMTFFGLGPQMVEFSEGFKDAEQELYDLRQAQEYDAGTQAFLEKYPHLTAMTIATTEFTEGFKDPVTQLPIPGTEGVRTPANELAAEFLATPEAKALAAQGFGPLMGALFLSADGGTRGGTEFDPAVHTQMVADGLVRVKDITEFMTQAEAAGREDADPARLEEGEGFWNAVNAFYEWKGAREERLRNQGLSDDNVKWAEVRTAEQDFLKSLYAEFPMNAANHIDLDRENGDVSWVGVTIQSGMPDPLVMAKLRQFAAVDGIQGFDAVKGLKAYLSGRDALFKEMAKAGVTDIESTSAEKAGFTERYEQLVATTTANEAFGRIYDLYLRNDLGGVRNAADRQVERWQKSGDPRYEVLRTFDTQYEKQLDAARQEPVDSEERSFAYNQAAKLFDDFMEKNPKLTDIWWNSKSYSERESYMEGLYSRPVVFMTRFDLSRLGPDIGAEAAKLLRYIGDERLNISIKSAYRDLHQTDYAPGDDYARLDRDVRDAMKVPNFGYVVSAVNQWGWALRKVPFMQDPSKAAVIWGDVFGFVDAAQANANAKELHGDGYFASDADTAYYAGMREDLKNYITQFKTPESPYYNRLFHKQYRWLADSVGDPLPEYLIPEVYFPLGGFPNG